MAPRPSDDNKIGEARRADAGLVDLAEDQGPEYADGRELVGPSGKDLGDVEPMFFFIGHGGRWGNDMKHVEFFAAPVCGGEGECQRPVGVGGPVNGDDNAATANLVRVPIFRHDDHRALGACGQPTSNLAGEDTLVPGGIFRTEYERPGVPCLRLEDLSRRAELHRILDRDLDPLRVNEVAGGVENRVGTLLDGVQCFAAEECGSCDRKRIGVHNADAAALRFSLVERVSQRSMLFVLHADDDRAVRALALHGFLLGSSTTPPCRGSWLHNMADGLFRAGPTSPDQHRDVRIQVFAVNVGWLSERGSTARCPKLDRGTHMDERSKRNKLSEAPKLEFEMLLSQLIERAHEVMATQTRLRDLISASNTIVSDLDLSTVLTSIAEVARRLLGAEYAAMGVTAGDGHLEQFIHVGMPAETVAKIDHLPEGKGLLGALIEDPQPVRLRTLSDDQRSSGFPAGHPPMESFLGMPIRVRDEVYGNLYLTNQKNGEFTADDEAIAEALAASAGIAIANARLFEESRYRERWSTALAETNRHMLANEEESALQILVERMQELAEADVVCVILAVPERNALVVDRAIGHGADELLDMTFPLEGSIVQSVMTEGKAKILDQSEARPVDGFLHRTSMGQAILVPFDVNSHQPGILVVARSPDRPDFRDRDLEMASSFADQVTLAVQRADSRASQQRVELLEDRSRIARDLHDHVIQRLFGAGLTLQAVASGLGPGEPSRRITEQIRSIDETIAQIRESIFALKTDSQNPTGGLRSRVREIIDRVSDQLPSSASVRFLGPVDLMSNREVTDDAAAVVTEALANIVRHAKASNVTVAVAAADGQLSIDVIDDGKGFGEQALRSGLANLLDRATKRGGTFVVQDAKPQGTHLAWSIPV